jgi:hypothetical protein
MTSLGLKFVELNYTVLSKTTKLGTTGHPLRAEPVSLDEW